jgi:hypothetical protein
VSLPSAWDDGKPRWKERGKAVLDRIERKATVKAAEAAEKRKVCARDKTCRWPRCKPKSRLECAHVVSKGLGGDKGTRSTADQMIQLCYLHHQGPVSLHSGDLRIDMDTSQGTDGPVSFWQKDEDGVFFMVAREVSIGVTERASRRRSQRETEE